MTRILDGPSMTLSESMGEYFYVCLYGKLEGPPSIIYKDEEISDGNGYRFTLSDTLLFSDLIFFRW